MRSIILLSCSFFVFSFAQGQNSIFWKNMNDRQKQLELTKRSTSPSVEQFYFGHKPAGDSVSLDALMGTLSKADSAQLPFYFEVFCSKMPSYKDSLAINLYSVHVINMIHYHPAYTLDYLGTFNEPQCRAMFKEALTFGFSKMKWFYPDKESFKEKIESELNQKERAELEELLK